jgi:hypothetical protein
MREVLLQERPDLFGELEAARALCVQTARLHEEPVGSAFDF